MSSPFEIRPALTTDAAALLEIYRPYVQQTSVSIELEVPPVSRFAELIEAATEKWAWLVAQVDGRAVGYAYAGAHRARAAYAYSVETSVYIDAAHHRGGMARALYTELFARLQERNFASAYAGITLPNEASVGFHESFGFEPIGVFPKVGYKFDQWHDVMWLYRPIAATGDST